MQKSSSTKTKFHRQFTNAARPTKAPYFDTIGRDEASRKVNAGIEDTVGIHGHRAIEEIRKCLTLWTGPKSSGFKLEIIDGAGAVTDFEENDHAWHRFSSWYITMGYDSELRRARDAAIWFAEGYGQREIECKLKVRRGAGMGRKYILLGVREYAERAAWIKPRFDRF